MIDVSSSGHHFIAEAIGQYLEGRFDGRRATLECERIGSGRRSYGLGLQDLLGVFRVFLGTMPNDGGTIYLFGQLNPPLIAPVPEHEIEAMRLLTGVQATEMMMGARVDDAALSERDAPQAWWQAA